MLLCARQLVATRSFGSRLLRCGLVGFFLSGGAISGFLSGGSLAGGGPSWGGRPGGSACRAAGGAGRTGAVGIARMARRPGPAGKLPLEIQPLQCRASPRSATPAASRAAGCSGPSRKSRPTASRRRRKAGHAACAAPAGPACSVPASGTPVATADRARPPPAACASALNRDRSDKRSLSVSPCGGLPGSAACHRSQANQKTARAARAARSGRPAPSALSRRATPGTATRGCPRIRPSNAAACPSLSCSADAGCDVAVPSPAAVGCMLTWRRAPSPRFPPGHRPARTAATRGSGA